MSTWASGCQHLLYLARVQNAGDVRVEDFRLAVNFGLLRQSSGTLGNSYFSQLRFQSGYATGEASLVSAIGFCIINVGSSLARGIGEISNGSGNALSRYWIRLPVA